MQKSISFKNSKGLTLRGIVHTPRKYKTAVVLLHGFPGTGMGNRSRKIAMALEKAGHLALRFDFSGTNKSDGRFEDKLMSQEVKEIKSAIDFLEKNYNYKRLMLMGHSTGAIDAALYAHTDKRIDKLILSGAVSKLNEAARYDFTDEQVRQFWIKGYITYNYDGWVKGKRIKKAFYDEFFKLDIPKAIKKYKKPLLIFHGDKDEAIPAKKDPLELYKIANKPKKLVIVPNANHNYQGKKQFAAYAKAVIEFIDK